MTRTNIIRDMVVEAVQNATGKSTVPAAAATEAAKIIVNQTNSEPWFQSRVTLGSVASVMGAVTALLNMFATGDFDPVIAGGAIATLLGAGVALYGRWFAKKAIGA